MVKFKNYYYLAFLVLAILLPKWLIIKTNYSNELFIDIIFNIKDIQYFPIIISFSKFIFNPTYLENYYHSSLIGFPIYGVFFHSVFYKLIGAYSFILLEFIFQFLFLIIFFEVLKKIFNNSNFSLYFCIFIFLLIILIKIYLLTDNEFLYLKHFYNLLDENFGTRLPRPLFTSIVYFCFFYSIFFFKNNLKEFKLNYFIIVFFYISVFLNSFFYYFFNFIILIAYLFFKNLETNFLKFFLINKNKIFKLIIFFIIFCAPFIIQLFYGEKDYSNRIGVISIDFKQKIYLIKYYIKNLLRYEPLILIISTCIIHIYINKKFFFLKKQVENLNIFFYFILVSIISPIIFFLFSPKIVSIYHFLGILLFILIFYLLVSFCFILIQLIKFRFKFINHFFLKFILLSLILLLNLNIEYRNLKKNFDKINELQKIQVFLVKNNLVKSNKKLFTNDLKVMNLWLFNKNNQLAISDGFTNSLKNIEIETNLIKSLKGFGLSKKDFEKILSLGSSKMRDDLFMRLFTYRYQANSLFTFSHIDNYTEDLKNKIKNTSPFRAQSQVIPENEKKRLINQFVLTKVDNNNLPNIVIINKSLSLKKLKIYNQYYKLLHSSETYSIYLN